MHRGGATGEGQESRHRSCSLSAACTRAFGCCPESRHPCWSSRTSPHRPCSLRGSRQQRRCADSHAAAASVRARRFRRVHAHPHTFPAHSCMQIPRPCGPDTWIRDTRQRREPTVVGAQATALVADAVPLGAVCEAEALEHPCAAQSTATHALVSHARVVRDTCPPTPEQTTPSC